ncbi:MAG TPA: plastocyanin/azurin family copper-binding protein [Dehalococcoidia bacterium]|nr:plastocyanin/azurin family copper-binding protein [Dehalococcoidia bacterium]
MCIRGRVPGRIAVTGLLAAVLVLASAASVPGRSASAATMWQALTGAQSGDHAIQALAFLPNELTVDAGDSITWTFPTDEVHTVTFAFANSGVLLGGQQFTVAFATPGTFAFRCLIHSHMTGTVHVQAAGAPYPHDQTFYTQEGQQQGQALLVDGHTDRAQQQQAAAAGPGHQAATVGAGEISSTSGGQQSFLIARFLPGTLEVKAGDTVTWTALDPATPHTVTFGALPVPFTNPNPINLSGPGEQTTLSTPYPQLLSGTTVSSGFLGAFPGTQGTTFQVTFTAPGTYRYYCELHHDLGMTGTVIVH